ncbi:hypothetical protein [Spiroplasma attinicola]|uniref:hypothetical protein n=1 Tax=Spiroplasma attinicola TaxID=2904537 RepID=UPI002022A10B|nr:hypothetical protein [Spiroplasma sp. JKS002670]MCL8209553.1 hypothetical protein [Spiroplasma sp. JKS002670]
MEKDLKDLLVMFKTEQDYAERKNQIILVVLGILATVFATIIDKISMIHLWVLIAGFISVGFIIFCGFLPQGIIVKPFSNIFYKLIKKYSQKYKEKDNNYINFLNWKNFELTKNLDETEKAMIFFKIPINEKNKNICQQLLITSKIIYLKYFYFKLTCCLIFIWIIVIILVFVFVK